MTKTSFRNPYADRQESPDTDPFEREDLEDLNTQGTPQLSPVCWKCGQALSACKCHGGM